MKMKKTQNARKVAANRIKADARQFKNGGKR